MDFPLSDVVETLPFENLIGDRLRLTQVYLNLLNNAVKYTKAGGKVRLTVKEENITESGNVTLTCIIEDTGVGMSKELQKTMYESFTRVADSRVDKIQGTGLGLAIVKHMVELMNGDIMCDSELGAGTVFTVRIPLIAATEALPHAVEHIGDENSDLVGLHLLIAEDNDIQLGDHLRDVGRIRNRLRPRRKRTRICRFSACCRSRNV